MGMNNNQIGTYRVMATKTKQPVDLRKIWEDIISKKRKPPKDESIWLADSKLAFLYAKYIRGSRWSEKEEVCFHSDIKALYNYIYWVVKELNQEVPDHLHNFMLAMQLGNNFEGDKEWADLYFKNIKK
jgi:hypothetical protein